MTTYAVSPKKGNGWRNVRTGILFVIGIAIVASLALVIGKNTTMFTSHSIVHLLIPDIKGLNTGNLVSIAGKKVGTVSALEFQRANDSTHILVTMNVREEYFALLTQDSRAMIKSLGMLGDKYIDITLGNSKTYLQNGGFLVVVEDADLEGLADKASKTMTSIDAASESLVAILGKVERGEGSLGQLVNSTETSDRLNRAIGNIEAAAKMYGDPVVGRNFASSISNFNTMSSDMSKIASSIEQGNGTFGKLLKSDSLYNRMNSTIASADEMVVSVSKRTNSLLDSYQPGSAFYLNLNKSISSLDSLLLDIKRNPQRYLKISVF